MAQICKKEVETPIQCSAVKFYEVFKQRANLLPQICASIVTKIELVDGTSSWVNKVGSRNKVYIIVELGVKAEDFKDEVTEINDEAKKITFNVLEGTMMQFYDIYKTTLEVTACTAKWTVEFQKKNACYPDPDVYLNLLASVNMDVNAYLLVNPN